VNERVNGNVDKYVTVKSEDMINNCVNDEGNELFDEQALVHNGGALWNAQNTVPRGENSGGWKNQRH